MGFSNAPETNEGPKKNPAQGPMDDAFKAGDGPEVKKTNERLTDSDYKKVSLGFPKVTNMKQEDRDDLQFAKDNMPKPPEHYSDFPIKDGSGEPYAVVVYDAVAKSYTLFKSKLDIDQVEEKWAQVMKGKEIYPNAMVPGYDEMVQSSEGTVKTVNDGGKTYVMARLRGGKSRNGIRMSEA